MLSYSLPHTHTDDMLNYCIFNIMVIYASSNFRINNCWRGLTPRFALLTQGEDENKSVSQVHERESNP